MRYIHFACSNGSNNYNDYAAFSDGFSDEQISIISNEFGYDMFEINGECSCSYCGWEEISEEEYLASQEE